MLKKTRVRIKGKSIARLTKDLDAVFSRFIRLSRADKSGIVACYTCPFKTEYKKIHAGHYISRFYKATRWDERNVRPQCYMCNIWKKGNPVIFRSNLVKEYGEKALQEMEDSVHKVIRGGVKREELTQKIVEYTQKVRKYEGIVDKAVEK